MRRGFLSLAVVLLVVLYIPRGAPPVVLDFPHHLYSDRLQQQHQQQLPYTTLYPPCLPQHIHLAQSTNVDIVNGTVAMTVSFSLDYKACADAIPTVVYGLQALSPSGNDDEPETTVLLLPPQDRIEFNYTSAKSNGLYQSDWIYHAVLPNLQAGKQQYSYRIQVKQPPPQLPLEQIPKWQHAHHHNLRGTTTDGYVVTGATTPLYTFSTPPMPGSPTTLALVGDLGQTANSSQTMFYIWRAATTSNNNTGGVDMPLLNTHEDTVSNVLIAGDMSYADSDPTRWTSWFKLVEPLARTTALSVAAGNHEIECDEATNDVFVPYEHWFRNPNRIQAADMLPVSPDYKKTLWDESCSTPSAFQGHYNYGNAFYAYQHGLIHVIVLASYSDTTVGSVQYQWLERELQSVNREVTPWLLVSFHSPLYTTFLGHVDEVEAVNMKQAMEPLFVKFRVNLVVSGHDHGYMKTHSLAFGQVDPTGRSPIYMTLGAGGNREGHASGYRNSTKPEAWVAERNNEEFGYGHLNVPNATHARFQWIRDGTPVVGREEHEWIYNPHAINVNYVQIHV